MQQKSLHCAPVKNAQHKGKEANNGQERREKITKNKKEKQKKKSTWKSKNYGWADSEDFFEDATGWCMYICAYVYSKMCALMRHYRYICVCVCVWVVWQLDRQRFTLNSLLNLCARWRTRRPAIRLSQPSANGFMAIKSIYTQVYACMYMCVKTYVLY